MKIFTFGKYEVTATKQANTIWINCCALGWDFDLNATPNRQLADALYSLLVKA